MIRATTSSWRFAPRPGQLALALAATCWLATTMGLAKATTTAPVRQTQSGAVQGLTVGNEVQFLGIPYAAPPVGALRWRPPAAPVSWTGTRAATSFGDDCPQFLDNHPNTEDCLNLNIYAPASATTNSKLPVMVWLFGGAFVAGSAQLYDPTTLVTRGNLVAITINYRIGYLGFLAHPALSANDPHHVSGNYGLLDQQAALAWVRKNIGNFGGDGAKITVFGESAGGQSALTQLIMPDTVKLHSAIFESGAFAANYRSLAEAETAGQQSATTLGCPDQTLACLQALSATTLGNALAPLGHTLKISPNVDGYYIPQGPAAAFAAGDYQKVPVINGTNRDEWRIFTGIDRLYEIQPYKLTADQYTALVQSTYGTAAAQILAHYPVANYTQPDYAWAAINTDSTFACNAHLISAQMSHYSPVYEYELNDPNAPMGENPTPPHFHYNAAHSTDLDFIFPTFYETRSLHAPPAMSADQLHLASIMQDLWISLARNGHPQSSATGAVAWRHFPAVLSLRPPGTQLEWGFTTPGRHQCAFWAPTLLSAAGLPANAAY